MKSSNKQLWKRNLEVRDHFLELVVDKVAIISKYLVEGDFVNL